MTDLTWNSSTYCSNASGCDSGTCVEVSATESLILVRDSKLGDDSPVLTYTRDQWRELLAPVRAAFDEDEALKRLRPHVAPMGNGQYCWDPPGGTWAQQTGCLHFDGDEMKAWVAGARRGEFDLPEVTHA